MAAIDPSANDTANDVSTALEHLGRSRPELPPLLEQLNDRDRDAYMSAVFKLQGQWDNVSTRAVAAPDVLTCLYDRLGPNGQQSLRSLPLRLISLLAVGPVPEDCVPQGFDGTALADAKADEGADKDADARTAYAAVEATLPRVYPFLDDRKPLVREGAAHVLAFFPAARATAGPALLARLAREPDTEVRCTVSVALAMLHRGVAEAAARAEICVQLEKHWAAAAAALDANSGTDKENDAATARFTLALARCIVGVHAVGDVEVLVDVMTSPFDVKKLPREPALVASGAVEPTLPFASPSFKALAGRVLQRLPGPGPQSLEVVRVLAPRVRHAPLTCLAFAIEATLHCACGDDVPAAWPAFAALDERQQEAVRGLSKINGEAFIFLNSRLARWRLPTTLAGLKVYISGTTAEAAIRRSEAELNKEYAKLMEKVTKKRFCCGLLKLQ